MAEAGVPKWYLHLPAGDVGPYTLPELYRLLEVGEADPRDLAQAAGATGWMPLSEVLRTEDAAASAARASQGASQGRPSSTQKPAAASASYVLRHWRGELSLGVSYWLNTVLVSVALGIAIAVLSTADALQGARPRAAAAWLTGLVLVGLLLTVWQVVGTWRSADRHAQRGGRNFWAVAARALLCLGVLRGIADFGVAGVTAANAWRHAAVMESLPPGAFTLLRGATEIEFAGGIHPGTAARLREVLERAPRATVIHLAGPGGDMAEGHAMAALVQARGMDTYARSTCLSACTAVFLAGRNRLLREGARLGFHAPSVVAAGAEGARIIEVERRLLAASGVPEWFVAQAFSARGSALWFPTAAELTSARAVTFVTDGRHLSPGQPASPVTLAEIENTFRRDVLGAALAAASPEAFRDLATRLRAIQNDGGTVDDGVAALERVVAPLFAEALKRLPDRQIVAVVRSLTETARALGARDARICRDWLMHRPGSPAPAVAPLLTEQQRQALTQAMAEAITVAADPRQRVAPPPREPPQLHVVIRRLEARLPRGQMAVFDAPEGTAHPPIAVCTAMTELLSEILRLPEREAGALLRHLFASA